MADKITQGNKSIEKAFSIIEIMAHNQSPMRLQDIAKRCNMPPSTVLRMIATLEAMGYVEQDADSLHYFLTIKFCHLSNLVSRQMSIRNTIHPYLAELSERVGEYATIGIERDMEVLYIDDVNAQTKSVALRVGVVDNYARTAMLHSNGIGKLFLTKYDEQKLDYYIARFGLKRFTKNTIHTKEELIECLNETLDRGYSIDNEEREIGIRSVAAPIMDTTGNIIAGMSIAVPTARYSLEDLPKLAEPLLETTQRISRIFFSDEPASRDNDPLSGIL